VAINIEQQQQQLNKLGAELANLKKDQARLDAASKGGLLNKPDPKSAAGIKINTNLATATNKVNAKQKEYNALKKILDEAKADSKEVSEVGSAEEARLAALAGFEPNQIEEYRADVAKKLADKKDVKTSKETTEQEELKSQQMTKELAKAGEFVYQTLNGQGRKDLAAQLNAIYGSNLPISEFPSVALKGAYTQLLTDRFQRSQDEGRSISVTEFMELATREGTYKGTSGAGEPDIFASISNETEARALINGAFNTELGRDATTAEITKLTKQLNNAEKKNPFKTVKGIRTGGLNKEQFLKDEIVKLPEFAKKKTDKVALTGQSILGTAKANGVTLNQAEVDSFAKRVQDGTDIKIIDKEIRGIAALGMPDKVVKLLDQGIDLNTIYSPYKNLMASILELNPDSIDLRDPTLRSAIGPDKEIPIYDFEKALRKDYRWQYTDNAKRDVSNVALKVLRDFGFQA
jgi:hypothetical protein